MATIASTVMAIYVGFLHSQFPGIAGHLVSASILSAPAAIAMSKLLYPEDGLPLTSGRAVEADYKRSASWIEAIIRGAQDGVKLCVGIVALLLAFLGLLAMANFALSLFGGLSLEKILAVIYYPFTFIMGVSKQDMAAVARLLGERTIVTELVSYQHLSQYIGNGVLTNPRSIIITTYALCGFAHIASLAIFVGGISAICPRRAKDLARLAIFVGGISAICPRRAKDLARLGFRALFGATLACLMTGAVAGLFTTAAYSPIIKF
jgi:CNT family concentrative nucleoside transporter